MRVKYLKRNIGDNGQPDLAYIFTDGDNARPAVVFLGGFKSDMHGTKAAYLEAQCKARGQAFLRLDYSGHGLSGGNFEEGMVGIWAQDAADVIDSVIGKSRAIILVGSSMGGWIAMILVGRGEFNIKTLIGIAAAPDFTKDMYNHRLTDEQRAAIERDGQVELPNDYDDNPYILTKALFDDGAKHFVLDGSVAINCPMHLIQGKEDADVPWSWAEDTANHFGREKVKITYIDDGDHRLSRDEDLEVIDGAVKAAS